MALKGHWMVTEMYLPFSRLNGDWKVTEWRLSFFTEWWRFVLWVFFQSKVSLACLRWRGIVMHENQKPLYLNFFLVSPKLYTFSNWTFHTGCNSHIFGSANEHGLLCNIWSIFYCVTSYNCATSSTFFFFSFSATHVTITISLGSPCAPLTVNVLPVNEFTPVFYPSLLVVHVPEGLPEGKSKYRRNENYF